MSSTVKTKKINSRIERRIVIGMIVSDAFLRDIVPLYKPTFLRSTFARTVAAWCMSYYKKYKKAPGRTIQNLFEEKVNKGLSDEVADVIERFMSGLSDEYENIETFNAQHLVDVAEEYFKGQSLSVLVNNVKENLRNGNVKEAEEALTQYKRVEHIISTGFNPFTDKNVLIDAFENTRKPLFTFPGPLGYLLNEQFVREGFIGLMAPDKRGKTWWLMEFAMRALRARCNVVFFAIGDMSRMQMTTRFHIRLAGKSDLPKYCGELLVPCLDCLHNQLGRCKSKHRRSSVSLKTNIDEVISFEDASSKYKPCTYCHEHNLQKYKGAVWYKLRKPVTPLSWREGLRVGRRFMKRLRGATFEVESFPSREVNVRGLDNHLDIWEDQTGFVPDLIVIDYADNLAPEDNKMDFRHQENQKWQAMRAMSQRRRALVIAGTQTDACGYDREFLTMDNFSEDKRKNAHVTAMLALNQTPDEKNIGVIRPSWVLVREGEFDPRFTVRVIQSLQMGRPCLDSFF